MRHLKLLLVALAITFGFSVNAASSSAADSRNNSVSYEIEKMLKDSDLIIEEDFTVTVIFEVTEDRRISIRSVSSPNEEVNQFLEKRLQNRKLHGEGWFIEKMYELPVRVEAMK